MSFKMNPRCKHCGRRFPASKDQSEFCCDGCAHVYELIQEGGFGDFYERRDGVGLPVGERFLEIQDPVEIKEIQSSAHAEEDRCRITVGIQGMTCMGCAWLIERLAKRYRGVTDAKVALSSNCLSLTWKPGAFELPELAEELNNFGYRINGVRAEGGVMSPLFLRLCLTVVFNVNGILLSMLLAAGIGAEAFQPIFELLILAFMAFSFLVGGTVFLKPAWRGLLLGQINRDLIPAIVLSVILVLTLTLMLMGQNWAGFASTYFTVLTAVVFIRWLSEIWALQKTGA